MTKSDSPTKQECIADIWRVQKNLHGEDTEQLVSRDQYLKHGLIGRNVWEPLFGSFRQFRKEAELDRNREADKLARDIGKHVSVDRYRELSKERKEWGERYIRKNTARYQTILGFADVHDKNVDPFWLRVMLDTTHRVQPDIICIDGDLFDLSEFGRFYVDPREWDLVGRLEFVHNKILAPLRDMCKDAQIDLIEGNHEERLIKHLCNNSAATRVLLSDWHGWDVARALKLDEHQVNYVAHADLAAWTKREQKIESAKNFRLYYNCVVAHHEPEGRAMGFPGFNGHHHKHELWQSYSPQFGPFEWHQIGAGCRRNAVYTDGLRWANGFILVHVDTQDREVNFEYIPITNKAIVGGKFYYREKSEIVVPCTTKGMK